MNATIDLDITQLKDAMSRFATGVTVVTTRFGGQDYGMTCNSFNTVSMEPAMVLWSIRKSSMSHAAFTQGAGYVVNILAADQKDLALKFTQGSHAERFAGLEVARSLNEMPRLGGAASWFACSIEKIVSAGDHDILIGRVEDFGASENSAPSLIYAQRQFGRLATL